MPQCVSVAQSCLTLRDPMDCSPPGSSVHGIFQARILEWVVIPFSRFSQPRNQTQVSCIAGRFFTIWATRGVKVMPQVRTYYLELLNINLWLDWTLPENQKWHQVIIHVMVRHWAWLLYCNFPGGHFHANKYYILYPWCQLISSIKKHPWWLKASLIAQLAKNPPAMQETRVWFLGWEDSIEKEMATHSSILVWRIPWTNEPTRL